MNGFVRVLIIIAIIFGLLCFFAISFKSGYRQKQKEIDKYIKRKKKEENKLRKKDRTQEKFFIEFIGST